MGDRILVVGTYDTKDDELTYLAGVIRAQGGTALTMDVSVLGEPKSPTDWSKHQVIEAGDHVILIGRISAFAATQGADNAVMCDAIGHVAEFASANLWFAKDGKVVTPAVNHTFLNGITRQRVIALFKDAGVNVEERTVKPADLETADEIFSTGNYAKVTPVTRMNERSLQPGPLFRRARELYWDYARSRL